MIIICNDECNNIIILLLLYITKISYTFLLNKSNMSSYRQRLVIYIAVDH